MKFTHTKRILSEINAGFSEDFILSFSKGDLVKNIRLEEDKKVSVSLYKDLGNFYVEFINEIEPEKTRTVSFGRISQARSVFEDKVKLAKSYY